MEHHITPIIINAKAAEKHLNQVKSEHASLLEGMANQSMKVQASNQQKEIQQQAQQQQDNQMAQEAQKAQADAQKESMDYALKTKELEIKKLALQEPTT